MFVFRTQIWFSEFNQYFSRLKFVGVGGILLPFFSHTKSESDLYLFIRNL